MDDKAKLEIEIEKERADKLRAEVIANGLAETCKTLRHRALAFVI